MYDKLYDCISKELNYNTNNIKEIIRLDGLNNLCYKIRYLDKYFFIRIYSNDTKNINFEKNIIELCSTKKLAPKLYYFSQKTGNMVMEWIDGVHPSEYKFSSYPFIDILVNKLHMLHDLATVNYFNPFDVIENNLEMCRNLDLELPPYINELIDKLNFIKSFCLKNLDYGLCHNDLTPFNIITSKNNLYFIDYEFSAMGDIFFDLATLTWMMSIEGRNYLLKAYFKEPNEYHYKKLYYYLFIVKFLNATWSLIKSNNSTCNYDYEKGANILFEELLNYTEYQNT